MPEHPPHPQYLDVDWPHSHDLLQGQPLQLENEYAIDPSRFDLLQGEPQPPPNIDRRRPRQDAVFSINHFEGQQFGGNDDYPFTFSDPQSQQYNQVYGGEQYYSTAPPYSGVENQSISNPPYYPDDVSAYTFGRGSTMPLGQHARTHAAQTPGLTPTIRSFQGGVEQAPVYSNIASPIAPNFGASPGYGTPVQTGLPFRDQGPGALHGSKRMRALDEGEASSVDGDTHEDSGVLAKGETAKPPPKPLGACARCKGLKVKCEFKTDPDICKRCLNGGHECVIPGRKKRRAPPRRDLLLGQIREQAAKIEELMKQLEEANKRANQKPSEDGQTANAPSPTHTTFTADHPSNISVETSEMTSEIGTPESTTDHITKPDVLDWIAKARESIEAFGGYINMGGPGVTQDMLGEDVLGWKDSSSESYEGESGEDTKSDIHVEVEDVDSASRGRVREASTSRVEATSPPAETSSSNTQSSRRKKDRSGIAREKLAILPNEAAPIGLLANLSLRKSRSRKSSRSRSVSTTSDNEFGVANDDYFRANSPGPNRSIMYTQHQTPYILRSGLVSPAEVEKLFQIYFDYINPSTSLLDPVIYNAQKTYWRSPFLFTVICGISSRFYYDRPDLYRLAMNCARLAAGSTLIGGQKSIETVQAYYLLSLYPVPARRWEEDRCWVYMGLAIRIATDLNLHLPHSVKPQNEQHAREMLNRTRTWLNCFNVDRSIASQYGKAAIINNRDYVANHTEFWYKESAYNIPGFDIHICGYNAELKVLADYRATIMNDPEHPVGLNKALDITVEASKTDDKLAHLWENWSARFREETCKETYFEFRTNLLKFVYSYARMTVLSFAFQHTFGRDSSQGFNDAFFWRCLRASRDLVRTLVDETGAPHLKHFLRHGPDAQCVFATFTCAFLIKLLHPRFVSYIPRETRVEIRDMIEEVANFLGQPAIAIDDRHGPKMYSRFLQGLLETPLSNIDHSPAALKRAMKSLSGHSPSPSSSDNQPSTTSVPVPARSLNEQGASDSQMLDGSGLHYTTQSTQPVDPSELYSAPLPFDSELLQSMQDITDSNWSNMVIPGFSWMDAMQHDNDVQMRYNPDANVGSNY